MTLFDAEAAGPASTPADAGSGARPGAGPDRARLRLVVAYDGTDFHGFAAQPVTRTVQGVLVEAIQQALRVPVEEFTCAGRTDSGVHAWGQVVDADGRSSGACGPATAARHPQPAARAGDRRRAPSTSSTPVSTPRRSASWRRYRYTIVNRPDPDPFLARYAWWVPEPLDVSLLRLGADPFVGEHDFAAFCRKGRGGVHDRPARPVFGVVCARRRCAALRDPRDGVLLADGALGRRHAGRHRDGSSHPR